MIHPPLMQSNYSRIRSTIDLYANNRPPPFPSPSFYFQSIWFDSRRKRKKREISVDFVDRPLVAISKSNQMRGSIRAAISILSFPRRRIRCHRRNWQHWHRLIPTPKWQPAPEAIRRLGGGRTHIGVNMQMRYTHTNASDIKRVADWLAEASNSISTQYTAIVTHELE